MNALEKPIGSVLKLFPLQNKKLQRLTLPYLQVGVSEVLNTDTTYQLDSFNAFNNKNRQLYAQHGSSSGVPFLGDMVAGGLFDSYTGPIVSQFVSQYLSRALSLHTLFPDEMRAIQKEFPDDPLLDIMKLSMSRYRNLHGHGGAQSSASPTDTPASLRSLVSEWDMQQYALVTDGDLFRACTELRQRWAGTPSAAAMAGALGRRRAASPHDAVTVLEECLLRGNSRGERDLDLLERAERGGCRGVWFTATVAPVALELQRRRALRRDARDASVAPPPRKSLLSDDELDRVEDAKLHAMAAQHPFCLDVVVSGVGSSRAFGVARNAFTDGAKKSLLDPTRERVVPLSVDHTPSRSDEFRRILQAGGTVEGDKGDAIDGNAFLNVSRSFGHRSMKNNPRCSPVQQKMTAVPSCFAWEMLEGDALVLCNHAVFETRQGEDSGVDEIAKVVGAELSAGSPPEAIAAAVCDFALRFGASHALQVMVAVATPGPADPPTAPAVPDFREWVEPGPLYVAACREAPEYKAALQQDCVRCGVSLGEMLALRYDGIKEVLSMRHRLPLSRLYPKECGALQQIMDEEAYLFERAMSSHGAVGMDYFDTLATSLLKSKGK